MLEWVSLEEASAIILEHIHPGGPERADLSSAPGRVLAEDIFAPVNLPPFHRSPLDGYAVRAADIEAAALNKPVELEVVKEIRAGSYSEDVLEFNQAVKILTGAPIPPGADLVIKYEDVKELGNRILVYQPLPAYANFCFAGEDIRQGELILSRGTMVDPAALSVLAALGVKDVPVYRVPRVAIISTGDELVDIGEARGQGKIYNSNLYALSAYVRQLGAQPVRQGTVADSMELTARKVAQALDDAEMVLTTGGVSVGDYDVVRDSLRSMGAKILFWRVKLSPGTPALCAVKDDKVILSLSGNPAAALISFHLLANPAIAKLLGSDDSGLERTTAVLQDDYLKVRNQRRFLRGHAYLEQGVLNVKLTGTQNTGVIKSMLNCNALIDIPENSAGFRIGDRVEVVLLKHL